jgi:hypothetical protein
MALIAGAALAPFLVPPASAVGAGIAGAAGAGLAPIGAAAGGGLLSSPIIQAILGTVGGNLLGGLFGGGQSPFEENVAQRLGITQQLIPQLQAQAAGQPTAATRAAGMQLSQQMKRLQQSYAASAQRQGIAGTTPARAQQGRLQAAKVQGMAGIMGASQIAAQQQLGQLAAGAPAQQFQIEQQRRQQKREFLTGIGQVMAEYRLQDSQGQADAQTRELVQTLLDVIRSLKGGV